MHLEPERRSERKVHGLERVLLRVGETMGADLVIGRLAGQLDESTLRAAATALVRRHPPLRVRVEAPSQFVYQDATSVPVQVELVEAEPGPEPGWQRAAIGETRRPFALDGGAACRFLLVRQPGAPTHVILAAPHAIVDGRCLLRLLHELLDGCATLLRGEALVWDELPITPAAFEVLRSPWFFRMTAPLLRQFWMSELRAHQASAALAPQAPIHAAKDVFSIATFREGSVDGGVRLREACRARQVTVGGALLAATWFATARLVFDQRGTLPSKMPVEVDVDMRQHAKPPLPDTFVGYYTGIVPLGGKVAPDTTFWALATQLRKRTTQAIHWGLPGLTHLIPEPIDDPFDFLARRGIDVLAASGTASLVATSNVGPYPYPSQYGPLRLDGIWGLNGASLLGPCLVAWLRYLDGRLFYNSVGAAPAMASSQVERFQDAVYELLESPPEELGLAEFCAA